MMEKDLTTPILDRARFHMEFWFEVMLASCPDFPSMEEFTWAALDEWEEGTQ